MQRTLNDLYLPDNSLLSALEVFFKGGPSSSFSLDSRAKDNMAGKLDALPNGRL